MATAFSDCATQEAMRKLVALVPAVVYRACFASVSIRDGDGTLQTPWASAESAREADEVQYRLRRGPCVESVRSGSVCHVVMSGLTAPWPELVPEMEPYEIGSVYSTPLKAEGTAVGSLNVYSRDAQPFAEGAQQMATEIADVAVSVLRLGRWVSERLVEAATDRDLISTATGVLMAWQGGDNGDAFATLRRTAVRDDASLTDVARRVLAAAADRQG